MGRPQDLVGAHHSALLNPSHSTPQVCARASSSATDQHQPASRVIAAMAITALYVPVEKVRPPLVQARVSDMTAEAATAGACTPLMRQLR